MVANVATVMAHYTPIKVRFSELDPYGHVNHAVYVMYFEVARTEALAFCGVPLDRMAEEGFQFVVTEVKLRYKRAAVVSEELTVETKALRQGRVRSTWTQRVLRGDEELVTAEVTAGITDTNGRPCRPPEWLFTALKPLLD